MKRLADEIRMTKPFSLLEEEVALSFMRTADLFYQRSLDFFRRYDLTPPQYNVLRILRGAPEPLACSQIAERMISRDPDITRLLDRLEAREWIQRERDTQDRRVVKALISAAGRRLLAQIDEPLKAHHRAQFAGIEKSQLKQIVQWMDEIRSIEIPKE